MIKCSERDENIININNWYKSLESIFETRCDK